MAVELWETLKEAIAVYTGLSPATFFTVLALFLAVYYVISGLFGSSDQYQRPREVQEESQPLPPPVQVGEVTEEELKQYDGSDPQKPLLMAIKGQIYDVSQSRYCVRIFLLSFWVDRICGFFLGFLSFFRGKC
jgi:membrane-associated progesterone receptor component